MTAFTDDLENDLEALTEHHAVPAIQVARTALMQMPEHQRLHFLKSELVRLEETPTIMPTQPSTGLPPGLRGAIHELSRHFPANLVADAAMLELPESVRKDVARSFLKAHLRERLAEREVALYTVVDVASNEELGKVAHLSQQMRVIDAVTGQPIDYVHLRTVPEYDFRKQDDAEPRQLALYRKATAE